MNWKSCGVEYDLIENGYIKFVESRGIDPGQDLLQIFAGPFEVDLSETGEDRACQRRRRWTTSF
jgi:hypothetical protein